MTRPVTVGVDGSEESMAAVAWAAAEASARGVPLRVVSAVGDRATESGPGQGVDFPSGPQGETAAARTRATWLFPSLETEEELLPAKPVQALLTAAEDAELLVIGSRGLGGLAGFILGSVGLPVLAHAARPVVAVREGAAPEPEPEQPGPVVVGLDLRHAHDTVLTFAFETAARRGLGVRAVHAWSMQALYGYPAALPSPEVVEQTGGAAEHSVQEALHPFRERFPEVPVEQAVGTGAVAPYLLEVSKDAGLLVVGRRIRRRPFPQRLGSVAHAALHHSARPVAVVPYE